MIKISNQDLKALAEKYNSIGKKAMYTYLTNDCGIKNPTCTFRRMKGNPELGYSQELDRFLFEITPTESSDNIFMTIDELCSSTKKEEPRSVVLQTEKREEMEKLIQELIGDRLLELSRYISINSASKKLIIDKTTLIRDGFQVFTH